MKSSLMVLVILFCQSQLFSLQIKGQVSDFETQQPLEGAAIILVQNLKIGTWSDENGEFELTITENYDTIELLVQFMGYKEQLIPIKQSQNLKISIALQPIALNIDGVSIVSSSSKGQEFVIKELDKLDIYTNPNSRADPIRAIQSLPFSSTTDETANLSLRGSPAHETGYVLNGVPIEDVFKLDQSNGVGQFSIFNTSIIKQVNVFASNPPLFYGNAASGLVALYTDDATKIESNSLNLTLAGIGYKMDRSLSRKSNLTSYFNMTFDDGLKLINPSAFSDLKSTQSYDLGNHYILEINKTSRFKILNYSLIENYEYKINRPEVTGLALQDKIRNLSIINFEKLINNETKLEINQGIDLSSASYELGNSSHNAKVQNYFSSLNLMRYGDFNTVHLGISTNFRNHKGHGTFPIYHWAIDKNQPYETYDLHDKYLIPEIYMYNKFQINEQFIISFANRKTIATSVNIEHFFSDQANLSYQLNAYNTIKFSMGRYNQYFFPGTEFDEATLVKSKHYSLDYIIQKESIGFSSSIYSKSTSYPNKTYQIFGFELFLEFNTDHLSTSLSFSHIQSQIEKEGLTYPSSWDLDYFIRHLAKYKFGDLFELNSVLLLRSGAFYLPVASSQYHEITNRYEPIYTDLTNQIRLPDYRIWDLSISKIFGLSTGSLLGFISCSNVLDKRNAESVKYDTFYNHKGFNHLGRRVIFVGAVYNW